LVNGYHRGFRNEAADAAGRIEGFAHQILHLVASLFPSASMMNFLSAEAWEEGGKRTAAVMPARAAPPDSCMIFSVIPYGNR
jgi:hypothetical protein